jgi:peroxiredoxin
MSELQGLQSRLRDIRATGTEVIAVSVDPVADNRRVVDKLGLEFEILSDPSREVITAYGVLHPGGGIGGRDIARPALLLIDAEGIVRWRDLTDNWRVRVRPDAVLAAVERLR